MKFNYLSTEEKPSIVLKSDLNFCQIIGLFFQDEDFGFWARIFPRGSLERVSHNEAGKMYWIK